MSLTIHTLSSEDSLAWDRFVREHPGANLYHLSGWKRVIEGAYGHRTYFLIGREQPRTREGPPPPASGEGQDAGPGGADGGSGAVAGVLPLVHMRHRLSGNRLVSLPFFDLGGVLARDGEAERALVSEAVGLAVRLGAAGIELRHAGEHACLGECAGGEGAGQETVFGTWGLLTRSHKVRMLLGLPATAGELMQSFKPKLRSQVRRPQKEGMTAQVGGADLLDDFYRVFAVNMRDLGSPVHAKRLMRGVLETFGESARILLCRKDRTPVACALVVAFGDTLYNPWASALRAYRQQSPNMLLYWSMLEHAIDRGLGRFDFGRSTPGEGTYRFKEQWGAVPEPLHWQVLQPGASRAEREDLAGNSLMQRASRAWQRLPVPVTRLIGPVIRKHIAL